jgi:hypothetical protein
VAVGPIEQDLQQHLGVSEVCIFSHINQRGREELIIAVESAVRPPADKLQDVIRKFAMFERVSVAFRAQFPRTESGAQKVRRADLKASLTRAGT